MTDTVDELRMSLPLFIRLLEFARENSKSDLDLHFLAENALKFTILGNKTLTMNDYTNVVEVPNG